MHVAVGELEDPRKLLDQAVTDMRADVAKMRQASAQVYQVLVETSKRMESFLCSLG